MATFSHTKLLPWIILTSKDNWSKHDLYEKHATWEGMFSLSKSQYSYVIFNMYISLSFSVSFTYELDGTVRCRGHSLQTKSHEDWLLLFSRIIGLGGPWFDHSNFNSRWSSLEIHELWKGCDRIYKDLDVHVSAIRQTCKATAKHLPKSIQHSKIFNYLLFFNEKQNKTFQISEST